MGAQTETPIALTALPEGHVLHVLEAPDAKLGPSKDLPLRAAGPEQWFLVGDNSLSPDDMKAVAQRLGDKAEIVDQSHGRIRIAIEGANASTMLAKGVALDLHPDSFPVGRSAITLCGHVTVHLTRIDAESFELMVLRSYALTLWESLVEMGLEFGIDCQPARS
jgi:sarcosine oxidase subunit gamma